MEAQLKNAVKEIPHVDNHLFNRCLPESCDQNVLPLVYAHSVHDIFVINVGTSWFHIG